MKNKVHAHLNNPAHRIIVSQGTIDAARWKIFGPQQYLCLCLFLLFAPPLLAEQILLYDREPNDSFGEAISITSPGDRDVVRIIGDLKGNDQDAYYWAIDEEDAGTRWNIRLEGRAGALTRVDIFDLTDFVEGETQTNLVGLKLEKRPPVLGTLATRDGTRPAVYNELLLEPGNYTLGVSHSGGEGSYSVEISRAGAERVNILEDDNGPEKPHLLQNRRVSTFLSQGEAVLGFTIPQDDAGAAWSITAQTPLGTTTRATLADAQGLALIEIQADGGTPVRRAGLQLPAGEYRLLTQTPTQVVQRFLLEPGAVSGNGMEVEPNDYEDQATALAAGESIGGKIGDPDHGDWLRFTVGADQEGRSWTLVATPDGTIRDLELCLFSRSLDIQHCRRKGADGTTTLNDIALPPGEYLLRLDPRGGEGDWKLAWVEGEPVAPGREVEPNDSARFAAVFPDRPVASGHFHGKETDFWRFTVSGEPQLWRAQLQGEGLFELLAYNNAGQLLQKVRAPAGVERIRLENLYLMPGEYYVAASGTDGDYRLLLRPFGPPDPNGEIEPNDAYQNALPLVFGQQRNGFLPSTDDRDMYQFELAGPEHVKLTATPPADSTMSGVLAVGDDQGQISIIHGSTPGKPMVWEAFLPAGDYSLSLTARSLSDAEYTVGLQRLEWFDGSVDREPNNELETASILTPSGMVFGEVGATRAATDWFLLPDIATATEVHVPALPGVHVRLWAAGDMNTNLLARDADGSGQSAALAPGERYTLEITGAGPYEFNLFAAGGETPVRPSTPVGMELHIDPPAAVQAFSAWEQRLRGRIDLVNEGAEARELVLESLLSDDRWQLEAERAALTLQPGESASVPFTLLVPPNAWSEPAVRVNVRAVTPDGAESSALAEVAGDSERLPVNPHHHWSVIPALRGGFNVAAAAIGGRPISSPGIEDRQLEGISGRLIDGLTAYGRWTEAALTVRTGNVMQPTFDLAGDDPVPVAGFLLNPTSTVSSNTYLRDFAVALSLDGEQFETVLEGRLRPVPREQAFVLEQPVEARYARLIPRTATFGASDSVSNVKLGEFKVVAEPGFVPAGWERPNLAAHEVGGHLVWSEPWIASSGFDTSLLAKDGKTRVLRPEAGQPVSVVLGFHHSRAGLVTGVTLEALDGAAADSTYTRVSVDRGTGSPVGPFEPVGEWSVQGGIAEITFEKPVWARYLKFRLEGADGQKNITLPDAIAVWEAPAVPGNSQGGNSYSSLLGEWGHYSSDGPLEALDEPRWVGPTTRPDNDSRERALRLRPGATAAGAALLDNYDAWYRLDVPAGQNTVDLVLDGLPSLQAAPQLLDAAGGEVPLFEDRQTPQTVNFQAFVEPGASYWLRVYEPPRALMFSWDTSASVGWYLPSMANALYRYAENIHPDRDTVNLLPFGRMAPLLEQWEGQPYPLKLMLNTYPHETSSSNAEEALMVASRALAEQPGKKGVVLLTDAATNFEKGLWPALRAVRPIVFAMSVTSEGALGSNPPEEQDLMQEWSRVNGGNYEYVTGLGALQRAYGRAIARMRQTVTFEARADFAFTEVPGPATLAVVSGGKLDPGARGAVELILDASGSMLKRMGDRRRIEIAKTAVAEVVESVLPDGMPLALRVYGHREAGSCRTDLEVPLGPLDKAALHRKLDSINAVNLAKTPIAESLARVADDLAAVQGRRWVILLTDGEETCDGDVAAVLEELSQKGIDVRLNIVGFAISDNALKTEFSRLAGLGGGTYFDAGEADALAQAMEQSLRIPFRVLNSEGEVVAKGVLDGEALELPAGHYEVELDTAPSQRFRDVRLAPGETRELSAKR